ncbi:MAG TPA: hypothetical protein VGC80_11055, partial [Acetobacteraceae bacterium]
VAFSIPIGPPAPPAEEALPPRPLTAWDVLLRGDAPPPPAAPADPDGFRAMLRRWFRMARRVEGKEK